VEEKTAVRVSGVVRLALLAIDVFLLVRICLEGTIPPAAIVLAVSFGLLLGSMVMEAR